MLPRKSVLAQTRPGSMFADCACDNVKEEGGAGSEPFRALASPQNSHFWDECKAEGKPCAAAEVQQLIRHWSGFILARPDNDRKCFPPN